MIGKIIGAVAGAQAGKMANGLSGPGGAVAGVVAATVVRRLGLVGLVAAVGGGYALKRLSEKEGKAASAPNPKA